MTFLIRPCALALLPYSSWAHTSHCSTDTPASLQTHSKGRREPSGLGRRLRGPHASAGRQEHRRWAEEVTPAASLDLHLHTVEDMARPQQVEKEVSERALGFHPS